MLPTERRARLLRELRVHGTVRTEEFALRVGASGMTLRRDLAELEQQGLLRRVHGGAVSSSEPATSPRSSAPVATIGMVIPSASYYFPDVIRGAQAAITAAGSRMILAVSEYSPTREREQITRLLDRGVDGLLVAPASHATEDPETYRLLANAPAAVVVLERSLEGSPWQGELDVVRCDHEVGGQRAATHLLESGCTRLLVATRRGPTAPLVRAGARQVAQAAGLKLEVLTLPPATAPGAELHQALAAIADRARTGDVDGVIVVPDEVAIGLVDLAEDAGLAVPGDLAVVAYDDEVAALCATPLTAVAPPRRDAGTSGAELCLRRVMARLRSDVAPARSNLALSPALKIRETTIS
ncbi:substrate-binding domain-containing protein [Ruania alkalisoli]|uniref:Substrate-binding domain-containing protein n=1 Tax=Ruania alkalisoli TaxID=2779775 RepID=A0A7M1SW47_9MICO|nr:LacI family DNA-binding transcriptional regulator [Ruania alkalisoli]QOR71184.1 substrate-binding domain-containing protein [Ruania alkalisoli]